MKFTALKDDFLKGLNVASRAVASNNTLPILSNILLKAEGTKLYFSATNLEISIQYFISTNILNEGQITIPARLCQNYVSLLNNEEVEISISDGQTINLKTKESNTQIKGLPSEDFPQIPTVSKDFEITVPCKDFRESINEVSFSTASSSSRPILSGVFMSGKEKSLTLASTDSYRLSEKKLDLTKEIEGEVEIIIPSKTLIEVSKLLSETDKEELTLIISEKQILFKIDNIELSSRLIDGQFPNYRQVLPKNEQSKIFINKQLLLQNIKRVSLFAKENNNNVKLELDSENQQLTLKTDATQIGTEEAHIKARIEGDSNKIALNSEYIVELLQAIKAEEIMIAIDDKMAPALFKNQSDPNYLHIIMPLKI
jgi:DNA polymerase-3 subunit beta